MIGHYSGKTKWLHLDVGDGMLCNAIIRSPTNIVFESEYGGVTYTFQLISEDGKRFDGEQDITETTVWCTLMVDDGKMTIKGKWIEIGYESDWDAALFIDEDD